MKIIEAVEQATIAIQIDPLSPIVRLALGMNLVAAGQIEPETMKSWPLFSHCFQKLVIIYKQLEGLESLYSYR